MILNVLFVATMSVAAVAASAPTIPEPTKQAGGRTPEHQKALREAIQLHDVGDYPGAIRRFEHVIEENPNDATAYYELSQTLAAAKKYRRSLDVALKAAEFDSPSLPHIYSLIASDLDDLDDSQAAEAVYQKGMRAFPDKAILPFNYAITLRRMKKTDDARRMFQTALRLDPAHASSHYHLASLWAENGYPIPSVLASLRFLELAQDTQRCQQALQSVFNQFFGGAQSGSAPNHINVTINMADGKKDEGDFTGAATMLGLGAALRFTDEGKKKTRPELLVSQTEMLFETFDNNKNVRKDKKHFAAAYYAAYFRELTKARHTEAFTYTILRQTGWPEVKQWLEANPDKVKAYAEWSTAYEWPTDGKGKKTRNRDAGI